jgi:hypothetical protein
LNEIVLELGEIGQVRERGIEMMTDCVEKKNRESESEKRDLVQVCFEVVGLGKGDVRDLIKVKDEVNWKRFEEVMVVNG